MVTRSFLLFDGEFEFHPLKSFWQLHDVLTVARPAVSEIVRLNGQRVNMSSIAFAKLFCLFPGIDGFCFIARFEEV